MLEKTPSFKTAFQCYEKYVCNESHSNLLLMSVVSLISEHQTNNRKYPCSSYPYSYSKKFISHNQRQEPTPLRQQNAILAKRVQHLEQKVAEQDRQLAFLDPGHDRYAPKLAAVVSAWLNYNEQPGRTPKQSLLQFLRRNASNYGLVDSEGNPKCLDDLAAIANWKTNGGAPKTPSKKSFH
ncbi:hypothetical protein ACF8QD_01155 [Aeromonas media]|uniref:hypothetical protein n=1 Tax=Aeromonas media TaxID=651 RepID=UPI00370C810B